MPETGDKKNVVPMVNDPTKAILKIHSNISKLKQSPVTDNVNGDLLNEMLHVSQSLSTNCCLMITSLNSRPLLLRSYKNIIFLINIKLNEF